MPELAQSEQQVSDGTNLLISMLVRYPEIGTINFNHDTNSLKITCMISGIPTIKDFAATKILIVNSIAAYHLLKGAEANLIDIELTSYEHVGMLIITRDVDTFSRGELGLTIKLLRDRFAERLVTDHNDSMLEEDLLFQEEVIEDMLENMRTKETDHKNLIGIREDGRVFVFNK